jgi:general stress protein YciG
MAKGNGDKKDNGKMTVEEAGKKYGEVVVDKYGLEHMAEIVRKGGEHSHDSMAKVLTKTTMRVEGLMTETMVMTEA